MYMLGKLFQYWKLACVGRCSADNGINVCCVFYGRQVSVGLSAEALSISPIQWWAHKVELTGLGRGNIDQRS